MDYEWLVQHKTTKLNNCFLYLKSTEQNKLISYLRIEQVYMIPVTPYQVSEWIKFSSVSIIQLQYRSQASNKIYKLI